ncbi:hypothetical protein [Phenylobacterium sp. SCN 70-31]|uniref:hypothetical protein n=1 Tax=Phenylobacterium sp. SCN 70-31 TaxID=1660129 RepID=UPI000869C7E4|nr:hypothetical protein [Phenylobacterium sp. SCN 70-31]ODT83932.1 MAG: hypothetical protein ABS78_23060 [Phenylobacterium sp. SCN 70-31]
MRWTSWAALALCAGLVTGCGDKTDKAGAAGDDSAKGSASKVAAEDKVRCPARVKTPGRAAGAPVDDVLGIRPGLTLDEAINIVRCEDKTLEVKVAERGFDLNTYGAKLRQGFHTTPKEPELSGEEALEQMRQRQMDRSLNRSRDAAPGQAFTVSAIGLPGEETVIGVWRTQRFEPEKNPPIDSLVAALTEKYGPPTTQDGKYTVWLYDSQGRLAGRDSPLVSSCRVNAYPGGFSVSPDCALGISAVIEPLRTNPALAESLNVGLTHQSLAYSKLEATQAALDQKEAARRAEELGKARDNAGAPKL